MITTPRIFEDKLATRAQTPLLIGLMGPSGSGKTFSALRLATGIQRVSGGDIFFIDTEARRALHYAEQFKFRHIDFKAPFGPLDYLAAIEHCKERGARTIIIDSQSHEHEGPGGVLEMHDAEMNGDFKKSMIAWKRPKMERRRLLNSLLQMPINFIFCFRAKEKLKPQPGKEPTNLGFMPICGEEFVFEMTANALLLPHSGGVPTWISDFQGEKLMMKLPAQFESLFRNPEPLSEKTGEAMAQWARGGTVTTGSGTTGAGQSGSTTSAAMPAGWADWSIEERGENRARAGNEALAEWWATLSVADKKAHKHALDAEWKPLAAQAAGSAN